MRVVEGLTEGLSWRRRAAPLQALPVGTTVTREVSGVVEASGERGRLREENERGGVDTGEEEGGEEEITRGEDGWGGAERERKGEGREGGKEVKMKVRTWEATTPYSKTPDGAAHPLSPGPSP